jgi:hypothetical protein
VFIFPSDIPPPCSLIPLPCLSPITLILPSHIHCSLTPNSSTSSSPVSGSLITSDNPTAYSHLLPLLILASSSFPITVWPLLCLHPAMFRIRNRIRICMDPHSFGRLDPDPHSKCGSGFGSRGSKKG